MSQDFFKSVPVIIIIVASFFFNPLECQKTTVVVLYDLGYNNFNKKLEPKMLRLALYCNPTGLSVKHCLDSTIVDAYCRE